MFYFKVALNKLPTLASPFIGQQLVAFLAAALEAAHRVSAHMITPPVVQTALIDVCGEIIFMRFGKIKSLNTTKNERKFNLRLMVSFGNWVQL